MKNTLIIAEAGVNHNGSIDIAKEMIDVAALAGADFIKFQSFKAKNLLTKKSEKAIYQKKHSNINETQYQMLKNLELKSSDHIELIKYCEKSNIKFLSSPFDIESIELLNDLKIPIFKIPSGEITNYPYLNYISKLGKQIIMSTGMATLDEIKQALKVLMRGGVKIDDITVLHCNTEYPTPISDVNLNAMLTIQNSLGVNVGYSDHTLGLEIPIGAVALGAKVIEKHFTLDRSMSGPDHNASLNPDELKQMIKSIRIIEKALGNGIKKPTKSEKKNIEVARKSIVASRKIKIGEKFTSRNLCVKRPGSGISPMKWNEVIGMKSLRDYNKDDLI